MELLVLIGLAGLFINLYYNYEITKDQFVLSKQESTERMIESAESFKSMYSVVGTKFETILISVLEWISHIVFYLFVVSYIGNIYMIIFTIVKTIFVSYMQYIGYKSVANEDFEMEETTKQEDILMKIYCILDTLYLMIVVYKIAQMWLF